MNVHPFHEVVANAQEVMGRGGLIHQQFNCSGCGTKQTMEVANKFFTRGICQECGVETDIVQTGCNFMVVWERASR